MRVPYCLTAALALLTWARPAAAQVLIGNPRAKPAEGHWRNTYLGWEPKAWFASKSVLTPALLAQASTRPADSLSLVLPPDYHVQQPNGNQYFRVHLLNPTARPLPIERADATLMGVGLVLRLDEQWVRPAYPQTSYCGNSFWQDTLAAHSALTFDLDAYLFHQGTVPVQARIVAQVDKTTVKSAVFTVQLTPLQLYYLRYPRVPLPDIR